MWNNVLMIVMILLMCVWNNIIINILMKVMILLIMCVCVYYNV